MSNDGLANTFLLESIKHKASIELERRIERHLKDEFNHKWLPQIMKQVKKTTLIDVVSTKDYLELKITTTDEGK